jgi:hypothetical protein
LEAKWENTFSIFQEWCPFLDEKWEENKRKKKTKQKKTKIDTRKVNREKKIL